MRKIATLATGFLILLLAACGGSGSQSNSTPTNSGDSVSIPTPSAKPAAYVGPTYTQAELLSALQSASPAWTENEPTPGVLASYSNSAGCLINVYPSFQEAINNDVGSYGEDWSYSGSYGQFGLVLAGNLEACSAKFSSEIHFAKRSNSIDNQSNLLIANKANINECLTHHAECFKKSGVVLPGPNLITGAETLAELLILDEHGFCEDTISDMVDAAMTGCNIPKSRTGTESSDLWVSETRVDIDILRQAASTAKDSGSSKYMIYGDGWAITVWGSTEAHKALLLEMNSLVKGTLVAKY
ncbi:MAG: hypothetical protein RIQ88_667 [Actinomycetota bacterium]